MNVSREEIKRNQKLKSQTNDNKKNKRKENKNIFSVYHGNTIEISILQEGQQNVVLYFLENIVEFDLKIYVT